MAEFLSAVAANDTSRLVALMKSDVRFVSDGGGKAPAALRVVNSPAEVAQLIMHLAGATGGPREMKFLSLNGVPSAWFVDGQGFETVAQLDVDGDLIGAIYIVRNPEKLAHIKPH
jgi:RNA polymerase sigma-70 factor (ECF subfamily)